jgi:hypothetical protein
VAFFHQKKKLLLFMQSDWLLEDHSKVGLDWAGLTLWFQFAFFPNLSSSTVGFTPEDIIWAYRLLPGRIILLFGPMLVWIEEFMGGIVYRSFGIYCKQWHPKRWCRLGPRKSITFIIWA